MPYFPPDNARRAEMPRLAETPTTVVPRSRPAAPVSRLSVAQRTLVSSLRSGVTDRLGAQRMPYGPMAVSPAMQHQQPTQRGVCRLAKPAWIVDGAPVGPGQAFAAQWRPSRKELQGALAKVHSQLQSAASPALADDFRTALFTPDATTEEKDYALKSSSAAQQSFLRPVAVFLLACQNWLNDEDDDLPEQARKMLVRLQAFLQSCRGPGLAAEARNLAQCLDAIQAYVGTCGGASIEIPKYVQAALAIIANEAAERVCENCELFKIVHTRLADIEHRLDKKRYAQTRNRCIGLTFFELAHEGDNYAHVESTP